jgi:hypothetical protein
MVLNGAKCQLTVPGAMLVRGVPLKISVSIWTAVNRKQSLISYGAM